MPQWFKDALDFLRSDYLNQLWWLMAGYAACYAAALGLARLPGTSDNTIVYQCRRGCGIAFLLHALASLGVMVHWYMQNGIFNRFWQFFPFYIAILFFDLCCAVGLFASRQRFVSYHE